MKNRSSSRATPDFEALFQYAPGLCLALTPDLRIVAVSDAYLRATMTRRSEILGRGIFEVFPDNPADLDATGARNLRSSLERVLQFKIPDRMAVQKYDIRKPAKEGGGFEERHWNPVNSPVLSADGKVDYIIHSVEDVTETVLLRRQGIEQQKLMDELRGEERFRKAFNANPEPITIATMAEGRYIDVNERFLHVTGYRREEVIGRTSLELRVWKQPEDRAQLIETLKKQRAVRDLELTFLTKTGAERTGLASAEIIEIGGQECNLTIVKDLTDQKSIEKQLRQAQKMEAIGQLSGGIAHDFNNLLGVILGYSELIKQELPPRDPLQRNCEQIIKAGQSAASLTRQLLAFSRQQVLEPRVIDLNNVVLEVEKMLRRLIGADIDLRTSLGAPMANVKADPGQIEQVILNLVVNARDAMPQGGTLTIESASVELDEEHARRHPPHRAGPFIVLTVSDTGAGMDAETQARIFEPFFTTKALGKGTGLGLSTVYGVVHQSGGTIWVYSELGHGTTFKIYLPRVDELAEPDMPREIVTDSFRGSETILLVEDQEALRELTRDILAEAGYKVLVGEAPEQAFRIAQEYKGQIHLVLTDVVMPGMNGPAFIKKLLPTRLELRVLYMSGYTGFTHRDLLDSEAIALRKPFTRETLLRQVREVLSAGAELNLP